MYFHNVFIVPVEQRKYYSENYIDVQETGIYQKAHEMKLKLNLYKFFMMYKDPSYVLSWLSVAHLTYFLLAIYFGIALYLQEKLESSAKRAPMYHTQRFFRKLANSNVWQMKANKW